MKKNIMLRLSAILLVAVLLTTCVISGTWAKYTSNGSAGDTARVAKWGVTIEATDDGDAKAVLDTLDSNNEAEIAVDKELKLLAPGTKGGLVAVNVNGTPEVAVNVEVVFNLTLTGWTIDGAEYMPLVFKATIGGVDKEYKLGAVAGEGVYTSIADLSAAIKTDIEAVNGAKQENVDLTTVLDLQLSWEWAFEGAIDAYQNDADDTALGDLNVAPTMTVTYSILVEQID